LWLRLASNSNFMFHRASDEAALAFGGIFQTSLDILLRQIRVIVKDIPDRHPDCQPPQHIAHGDPQPSDAGFPAALAQFNGNIDASFGGVLQAGIAATRGVESETTVAMGLGRDGT
jgi:hypothetical protein